MRPDWDADSPELRQNLTGLLQSIEQDARLRKSPTVETARRWQSEIMRNLQADPKYVGAFRGEAGLEDVQVHVNRVFGIAAPEVAEALRGFEQRLKAVVAYLDNLVFPGAEPNADQTKVIVEVCAWAHAEWVPDLEPFLDFDENNAFHVHNASANAVSERVCNGGKGKAVRERKSIDREFGRAGR